jgi:hypothetical protein
MPIFFFSIVSIFIFILDNIQKYEIQELKYDE